MWRDALAISYAARVAADVRAQTSAAAVTLSLKKHRSDPSFIVPEVEMMRNILMLSHHFIINSHCNGIRGVSAVTKMPYFILQVL